jgi:hypothetical protein
MRLRIRSAVVACVSLLTIAAAHAEGACSKPRTPSCATEPGRFEGEEGYDQCRMLMLKYKSGMEGFAECLDQASLPANAESARNELEQSLALFNRKARGEYDH